MPFPYAIISTESNSPPSLEGLNAWSRGRPLNATSQSSGEGVYCGWAFENSVFTAWIDPLGFSPLFYALHENRLYISPSIHQLLASGVPPAINETAMAVFLRLGFFLDEDTPYTHIHALPPNGRLRFENGKLSVRGELSIPEQISITRDEAIDGFIERTRAAIQRRPPTGQTPAILLSGGRDSRHIALELHHQGHTDLTAFTLDRVQRGQIRDLDAAAMLAEHVGFRQITRKRSASLYQASRLATVLAGMITDESAWMMNIVSEVEGNVSCLYDGIGGDTLFAGLRLNTTNLQLARSGDLDGLTHSFLSASNMTDQDRLRLVAQRDRARYSYDKAFERVRTSVERVIAAPNPTGMFYFWHRTRRELGASVCNFFGAIPVVHMPLIDEDVYAFTASLPAELMVDGDMHTAAIARAFPDASHIPYAGGRQPIYRSPRLMIAACRDSLDLLNAGRMGPEGLARAVRIMALIASGRTGGLVPNQLLYYLLDIERLQTSDYAKQIIVAFDRYSPVRGSYRPVL